MFYKKYMGKPLRICYTIYIYKRQIHTCVCRKEANYGRNQTISVFAPGGR